ncbi:MAG TPA: serine/threonine-protein kinase [Gemmatimonadales bacterium]|nr:serine/threonine-protein kinase [Gemmatimonadales bacterium]
MTPRIARPTLGDAHQHIAIHVTPFRPRGPGWSLQGNLTGQTLDGRYRIDALIGQGGMAYVYLAHDLECDREVAIKVLLPQLTIDEDSVERLRREAVIAMRLDHPNVCNILAVGETDELPIYLVMPYLAGEPLALRELRGGPLSVDYAVPLLVQICDGLEHAHALHILHRDLKPENVMLVTDRDVEGGVRAVLLDFGLAKVLRDEPGLVGLTRSGFTIGTPEFMSPEQVLGKDLDWRSDQYALGVLAFEMFTGRVPFEGSSPQEVTLARLKRQPLQLRALRPDLPEKLESVIGRSLATDPADRYPSMKEMRAALGSVIQKRSLFGRLFRDA